MCWLLLNFYKHKICKPSVVRKLRSRLLRRSSEKIVAQCTMGLPFSPRPYWRHLTVRGAPSFLNKTHSFLDFFTLYSCSDLNETPLLPSCPSQVGRSGLNRKHGGRKEDGECDGVGPGRTPLHVDECLSRPASQHRSFPH